MNFFKFSPKSVLGLLALIVVWMFLEIIAFGAFQESYLPEGNLTGVWLILHLALLLGLPVYLVISFIVRLFNK